ncbi:hypothetical protein ABPG75_007197 [Micractinium tetrahymenae]
MVAPGLVPAVPQLLHHAAGCVVLHKPPGVPFHATADHPGLLQVARSQQGSAHLPYTGPLFPVHRLDSLCSGVLALATSQEAAGELVSQFRKRQVQKYYVALSGRKPSKKMGTVSGGMERGRRGSWLLTRSTALPAVTRFTSCACEGARGPALRAFLLKPETGRTHQIRVAMKSLGAPVLGDERYALKQAAAHEDRGYLHCAALRFTLRGRPIQVVCPPQHGRHFAAAPFQQLFAGWFPRGVGEDLGVWFEDSKLLRSGPLAAEEAAGGAALDWQW